LDGGLSFLEAQRIQRAADSAALAGAVWMPTQLKIADARGRLAAQANGYDAVNHSVSTYDLALADPSGVSIYYYGSATDNPNEYQATVAHREHRWFLGILGFPDFNIQRSAIAAYSSLPRLGSANNYLGSSGILEDHDRLDINGINALLGTEGPCDNNHPSSWGGNGVGVAAGATKPAYLYYYCGMYLHWFNQSCAMRTGTTYAGQPCLGTFWLTMYGQEAFAQNGDAYNPGGNGIGNPTTGNPIVPGAWFLNSGSSQTCTRQLSDAESWYYTLQASGTCLNNPNVNNWDGTGSTYAHVNFQTHPDAPSVSSLLGAAQGFGYEIAIQTNPSALADADVQGTLPNGNPKHTSLNVYIWGAAFTHQGESRPYLPSIVNGSSITNQGQNASFNAKYDCNAVSGGGAGCINGGNTTNRVSGPSNQNLQLPDTATPLNHVPASNLIVTRYMMFMPPSASGTPATWATKGQPLLGINGSNNSDNTFTTDYLNQVGSALVAGNLSYFNDTSDSGVGFVGMPITYTFHGNAGPGPSTTGAGQVGATPGDLTDYDSSGYNDGNASAGTGYWPNYCYIVDPNWLNFPTSGGGNTASPIGVQLRTAENYFYVCPPHKTADANGNPLNGLPADRYWNQLYGSPSLSTLLITPTTAGVRIGSFNTKSSQVITYYTTMAITGTYGYGNNVITNTLPAKGVTTAFNVTTDPGQACRPIYDPNWGNDRIPFNMRGSDWTSVVAPSGLINTPYNSTNSLKLVPNALQTNYYSYHGQRCSWDFDSSLPSNNAGPDFNPISSAGSSPSGCASTTPGFNGQDANAARGLLDTPYIPSFAASNPIIGSVSGGTNHAFANIVCYEPYFHISNYHWSGSTRVKNDPSLPEATSNPALGVTWLTGGTYDLHIQNFGNAGFHSYSVKAEYEYPLPITGTLNNDPSQIVTNMYPVPNVYAVQSMTLYCNVGAIGSSANHVIFDLANIPSGNAGYTAVLELWDPGDVANTLNISILAPSGWGRGYGYQSGSLNAFSDPRGLNGLDTIASRVITLQSLRIYAFNKNIPTNGIINSPSGQVYLNVAASVNGQSRLNDQWVDMAFKLPSFTDYQSYLSQCATHDVPTDDCYYFQVDYNDSNSSGSASNAIQYANDNTTWELYIQNQPVHLVQ
jgi:hypothetical protein